METNLSLMFERKAKISCNGRRSGLSETRKMFFFWSDSSSWEISSTISVDMNDSLADISELNGECEPETNNEGDSSWHDHSDVSDQQLDDN